MKNAATFHPLETLSQIHSSDSQTKSKIFPTQRESDLKVAF